MAQDADQEGAECEDQGQCSNLKLFCPMPASLIAPSWRYTTEQNALDTYTGFVAFNENVIGIMCSF